MSATWSSKKGKNKGKGETEKQRKAKEQHPEGWVCTDMNLCKEKVKKWKIKRKNINGKVYGGRYKHWRGTAIK